MKIALACARIVDRDMEHNLAQMEKYMAKASVSGACLVCFGEAFLQGFNAFEWDYETDKNLAVSLKSNLFKRIRTMAGKYGIDVLFGYNELDGEKIYSSCALMTPEGIHHNYRRISRGWKEYWKTDDHYREGDCVIPFDYRGRKMVIALFMLTGPKKNGMAAADRNMPHKLHFAAGMCFTSIPLRKTAPSGVPCTSKTDR